MTGPVATNVHATAITIGGFGILFTGPSGSGKSALAFACMVAARRQGAAAALIADDQVLLSQCGDRLLASRPAAIAGLIELRGSGIVEVESVPSAMLDLAVRIVSLDRDERLPPSDERYRPDGFGSLPLVRLAAGMPEPLAVLAALHPPLRRLMPFL